MTRTRSSDQPEVKRTTGTPVQDGDSGAGTGVEPPEDETQRTPDGTVKVAPAGDANTTPADGDTSGLVRVSDPDLGAAAAPLIPTDVRKQEQPAEGLATSSTNPVAASLSRPSIPGTNHVKLLDDSTGHEVSPETVFEVHEGQTFGTATRTVNEQFLYPNTTRPAVQRLVNVGDRWPVGRIAEFRAAHPLATAQAGQPHPATGEAIEPSTRV